MTEQTKAILKPQPNSSIFGKLPADLRRKLNRAIADREPLTLKDICKEFRLSDHEVSRSAFYRYARRQRCLAAVREFAEMALPDGTCADVSDILPKILAYRVLDALDDESSSPDTIRKLVAAWRAVVQTRRDLANQQAPTDSQPSKSEPRS